MTDRTFKNINMLFVLSFKNGENDPAKNSYHEYYILLVKIKDFNALINNKSFFYQPIKNKQKANEKLVEMSRNDYYTTGNFVPSKILYTHY